MIQAVFVTMKGQSPLLMNRFPMDPAPEGHKATPEQQAEQAAHRAQDGELFVPGVAVQRAFVAAARYHKGKGRGTLQRTAAACLLVTPEQIRLGRTDYAIDARPVVVPSTGGRVVRYRPRIDEWTIRFTLEWDSVLLAEREVRAIAESMGQRVGLLDFRPDKGGPFGRCVVAEWSQRDAAM